MHKQTNIRKKNKKKTLNLINHIKNIRKKNNVNLMGVLRLAFKHDPQGAAKIMSNICKDDEKVSKLVDKLIKS
tara:strand:- start:191 stop:409 length:219 start_codon:yes stop_codon:yes gene_type:complete